MESNKEGNYKLSKKELDSLKEIDKTFPKILLKQLTEIYVRIAHHIRHILKRNIFSVVVLDVFHSFFCYHLCLVKAVVLLVL